MEKTLRETPVIRCEHGANCKWKCFALDYYGNGIGTLKNYEGAWKEWHEKQCGGKLIQSFIVDEDYLSLLSQRIKAKALTDEQIDEQIATGQEVDAYLKKVDDRLKKAVSEKELIATVAGIIRTRKAVKAQHQAVLGELE